MDENKKPDGEGPLFKLGLGVFSLLFILGGGALLAWLVFGGGWRVLFGAYIPAIR